MSFAAQRHGGIARLVRLAICAAGVGLSAGLAVFAGEPVTLQLKWRHQFQFAGYYAAMARGYYRDAGLEVRLLEAEPGHDPVEAVLQGRADFGVGTSELVLLRGRGEPVVVLAAIFQHSPLILLARKTQAVADLQALHDQPVMIEPQSAELLAYFRNEGVDPAQLHLVKHTFEVRDLIAGRVAAMSAYATDEPFQLRLAGVDCLTFTPRAGGIDFYGDNLFTTEAQIRAHPERVRRFREASLRGWDYALAHPEEIIALIRREYGPRKGVDHLRFEAEQTAQLMHPGLIEVGHMNPGRWRHIADTYAEFGMLPRDFDLAGFLYDPMPRRDMRWLVWTAALLGAALLATAGWIWPLLRLNRRQRAARAAAEAADAAKTRYLAFLAHEIRTPLNGLVGLVELLKTERLTQSQHELVALQERSTQCLLRLVDSVLDFARLDAGKLTVEQQPLPLPVFVAEVCELYRAAAQAKGIALRYEVRPDVPATVLTDAIRLRQILANLLSNAVKFTAQGGIELLVSAGPPTANGAPRLVFCVQDTGPGIAPELQARLFEPFSQVDANLVRRYGGSGLGLNISRQLAKLLGGDIALESAPGAGARFTLTITVGVMQPRLAV